MGDILPFIARIQAEGGWSAPERASLQALAEQLADQATPVEVSFGASDAGDPWCVVTDQDAEVLIHVARIGARVVVHYAADDVMAEAPDLRSALAQRLPANGRAGFKAANDDGREAQILIALVVGAAFAVEARTPLFGAGPALETHGRQAELEEVEAAAAPLRVEGAHREALAEPAHAPPEPTHTRSSSIAAAEAAQGVTAAQPVSLGAAAEATTASPVWRLAEDNAVIHFESATRLLGTDQDDLIVGGDRAELIVGGLGDDTLAGGGAPEGAWDTLVGGAGDDHLYLDGSTLAVGGDGADSFVLRPEQHDGGPQRLLGAIQDFRVFEGDRLVLADGRAPGLRFGDPISAETLKGLNLSERDQAPAATGQSGKPAPPKPPEGGQHPSEPVTVLEVDLDGDGAPDGYVAVLNTLSVEERAAILDHGHVAGARLDPADIL